MDVITFEFENIPADSLALLESLRPVRPGAKILAISQDRLLEKQFLNDAGIATAPWAAVHGCGRPRRGDRRARPARGAENHAPGL